MKARNGPLNISNSRWMAYAVAGLATASGGAVSTEGAIHYTDPRNVTLQGFAQATFSLDGLGDKIQFEHRDIKKGGATALDVAYFRVVGLLSASVRRERLGSTFSFLSNLKKGSLVSQGYLRQSFNWATMAIYVGGQFRQQGIGYIGFAFNNGSGKQYGWARVYMGGAFARKNNFKVLDYAYADPGEPIQAGQKKSDEPITGMGSLGLLAAGAAGLTAWRKSRFSRVSPDAP